MVISKTGFYKGFNSSRVVKIHVTAIETDTNAVYPVVGYEVDPVTGQRVGKDKRWTASGKFNLKSTTRKGDIESEWTTPEIVTKKAVRPIDPDDCITIYCAVRREPTGMHRIVSCNYKSPEDCADWARQNQRAFDVVVAYEPVEIVPVAEVSANV